MGPPEFSDPITIPFALTIPDPRPPSGMRRRGRHHPSFTDPGWFRRHYRHLNAHQDAGPAALAPDAEAGPGGAARTVAASVAAPPWAAPPRPSPAIRFIAHDPDNDPPDPDNEKLLIERALPDRHLHVPNDVDARPEPLVVPGPGWAAMLREGEAGSQPASPSVPAARGQQAERAFGERLGPGHLPLRSFLAQRETEYGKPGSVRPDFVTADGKTTSFEVKNYDLTTRSPRDLIRAVVRQALARKRNLPQGMRQIIAIDITGQTLSEEQRNAIKQAIVSRSGGVIGFDDIEFFTVRK